MIFELLLAKDITHHREPNVVLAVAKLTNNIMAKAPADRHTRSGQNRGSTDNFQSFHTG